MASDLFRARLSALVLFTAGSGFYLGSQSPVDWPHMFETLLSTAWLVGGASALNQWWERQPDAWMPRTAGRPLPAGRLAPRTVLWVGLAGSVAGLVALALLTNVVTSALGGVALAVYVLIYTPLKRRTWLNTMVGAIPGALPALMGWTAVRGWPGAGGWVLFGILALWQLPHFLAIGWIYREEYAGAGYRMLSGRDPEGRRSGCQAVGFAVVLCLCSLGLSALDLCGRFYFWGAMFLGLFVVSRALQFWAKPTVSTASQLFRASIWYLSLLLLLMLADKIPGEAAERRSAATAPASVLSFCD